MKCDKQSDDLQHLAGRFFLIIQVFLLYYKSFTFAGAGHFLDAPRLKKEGNHSGSASCERWALKEGESFSSRSASPEWDSEGKGMP